MRFVRHIIGLIVTLLFSALAATALPVAPITSLQVEFSPHHDAAKAAIAGDVAVMHGGAMALHEYEIRVVSLGFGGDLDAPNNAGDVVRVPTGPDYTPTTIGGRQYSSHALQRMDERGLTPSVVENTVDDAFLVGQGNRPNTIVYYDPTNRVQVVTNFIGDVVTVIPGNAPKPGALAPLGD